MGEVLNEALAYYNLPLTVLLLLVVIYWLMVIVGVLGMESFDIDAGTELDLDTDVDVDLHADAGGHPDLDVDPGGHAGGGGLGLTVLRFLNFGQVPAMVVVSVLILAMWFLSMVGNFILNGSGGLLIAGGVFLGSLFAGALLAKLVTAPLKPLFRALNRNYDTHEPIIGRNCVVKSIEVSDTNGQAEIEREGATLLINVRVAAGRGFLHRGDHALVVGHDVERDFFIIREDRNVTN